MTFYMSLCGFSAYMRFFRICGYPQIRIHYEDFFMQFHADMRISTRINRNRICAYEKQPHGQLYYKQSIDKIRVLLQKKDFWPKSEFLGPKKHTLLAGHHVLATIGQSCANKKVPFFHINISLLANFWCFFKRAEIWPNTGIFGPFGPMPT